MSTEQQLREALTLAANRLDRHAADFPTGSVARIELMDWTREARAILSQPSQPMPEASVVKEVVQHLNWQIKQAQNLAHVPEMATHIEKMRGWVSSLSGASASPAAPEGAAKHWHDLYRAKCLELNDERARLGGQIEGLEAELAEFEAAKPVTLTDVLQMRCVNWGVYWRGPDAHGVKLSNEQAIELLRDALGVEVEIATEAAKPEQQAQAGDPEAWGIWLDGEPPHPWREEWFIAETIYGDRVVLRYMGDDLSYQYKTADETYMVAKNIKRWMQFPDGQYISAATKAIAKKDAALQACVRVLEGGFDCEMADFDVAITKAKWAL